MSYRFIPSFFLYRNWVYGQVTRKSPCPKLSRRIQSYVAQNFELSRLKFHHAQKHPNIFIALFSSHQILKNEKYYSFIALVCSPHSFKNEMLCTLFIKISNDMTRHFGRLGDKTSGEMTFGATWPVTEELFLFPLLLSYQSQSEILLFTRQSRNLQLR